MRGLICFFLIFSFAKPAVWAQSAKAQEILTSEQRRFEAMTAIDTITLRGLLADDMTYIHSNALKETKQQHLSAIASGRLRYESMVREEVAVRQYGKIALTNGSIRVKGLSENKPFEVYLLYTAVYRKQKGVWQLVNWQSTKK